MPRSPNFRHSSPKRPSQNSPAAVPARGTTSGNPYTPEVKPGGADQTAFVEAFPPRSHPLAYRRSRRSFRLGDGARLLRHRAEQDIHRRPMPRYPVLVRKTNHIVRAASRASSWLRAWGGAGEAVHRIVQQVLKAVEFEVGGGRLRIALVPVQAEGRRDLPRIRVRGNARGGVLRFSAAIAFNGFRLPCGASCSALNVGAVFRSRRVRQYGTDSSGDNGRVSRK